MSLHRSFDEPSVSSRAWLEGRLAQCAAQIHLMITSGILGGGLSKPAENQVGAKDKSSAAAPEPAEAEAES